MAATKTDESRRMEKILSELQKLNSAVDDMRKSHEKLTERMEAEIAHIHKEIQRVSKLESDFEKNDIKGLRRDMEVLRIRNQWLEDSFKKLDHSPVFEKMEEIDQKIKVLKAMSPIVIE